MALRASKKALRKEITSKLSLLSQEEIKTQNESIIQQVINHPIFRNAGSISIYLSTPKEAYTLPILKEALNQRKTCYIPKYVIGKELQMLQLQSMADYEQLSETKWGIKQPGDEPRPDALEPGNRLDLIICPGVAFTLKGHRLGHGAGFYDKFLNNYAQKKDNRPYTMGLAFREQIADELPLDDHDYVLDEIICCLKN